MVGDDAAGAHIRSYLRDFGVDLIASPGPLGSSRAVSTRDRHGEPVYEFNDAAKGRRIRFDGQEKAALADAAMVVVSCFPFDDAEQTNEFADALAEAGVPLAIDPNPRSGMMSDRAEFVRGFERLAAKAALVKVGEDDAALLYDQPLDALRERLVDLGVATILATQGAAGATLEVGELVITRPVTTFRRPIVDTMGAGDAALAATVAGVVSGAPSGEDAWAAILQSAMDVAAATCRFEGALLRTPGALADLDLDTIGT
jgi:fructokinase